MTAYNHYETCGICHTANPAGCEREDCPQKRKKPSLLVLLPESEQYEASFPVEKVKRFITPMTGRIITKLTKTCGACPSQWDAEDSDGKVYYIRYRFGHLTVAEGGPGGNTVLAKSHGHRLNGSMDFEELKILTKDVFTFECEEI